MATRTITDIANSLGVSADVLLSEVKKIQRDVTLDSPVDDAGQMILLRNLVVNFIQTPKQLLETKSKMDLLYQYEKHYLELIKEHKEEIKFANSLQEDLRRERSQFFTQTLREVVQTLQTQEIDKKVASQWIEELVASYTKSIDLSSDLAKTHVVQVLNIFKEEAKQEVSKAKLDNIGANSSTKSVDAE